MTLMQFFGCALIAFGPPLAMFIFTIARDPLRIIVLIASGFFWLLSLLLSSVLWYAVVPLRNELAFGLVFSVIFQELFRFLFYKLLRKADEGLKEMSHGEDKNMSNKHIMAYVSGLGYGVLSGAFSIINVLADMSGPGTIGIKGDSQYFFLTTALLTLCFILLHTFWGVIFFNAMDRRRYVFVALVVISHMLVSCLTLFNQKVKVPENEAGIFKTEESYYLISLLSAYSVMVVVAISAFVTAGGSFRNIHTAFTCRKGRYEMD